jgi:hypothetical protein
VSSYMDTVDCGCLDLTFVRDNVEGISCLHLHNIAQFLGYNLWDHKSHEQNPPLIMGFLVYGEPSCYVLLTFQQEIVNCRSFNGNLFLWKETLSCSYLIILCKWVCINFLSNHANMYYSF